MTEAQLTAHLKASHPELAASMTPLSHPGLVVAGAGSLLGLHALMGGGLEGLEAMHRGRHARRRCDHTHP